MNLICAGVSRAVRNALMVACSLLSAHSLYSASIYSQPYTFTTLAGMAGSGSADGTGTNAQFTGPRGVAVDSAGNVYVADYDNHTIRKVTPAGEVSTLAGLAGSKGSADGLGSAARFNAPRGVAVDSVGNVYVADSLNFTIRKITSSGEVSTLAGLAGTFGSVDGLGSDARFSNLSGVALDSAGALYVADSGNNMIRKFTPGGEVSTLAGLGGSPGYADGAGTNARFSNPYGVVVDSTGTVYVADTGNFTIRKITPGGEVSTLAGQVHSSGSTDGTGSNARFFNPYGVAVDSAGNVFVADTSNFTIRRITPSGEVSTLAGQVRSSGCTDGTGSNARFYLPYGVAVDRGGNLYVADLGNYAIRLGRAAPAPPLLNLSPAGGQLILSWPLEGSNFLVEASSTLFPAPAWLPLTNAVGTNGTCCVLTNGLDTGARFFRLRLP
jgi:streptogramin lyase